MQNDQAHISVDKAVETLNSKPALTIVATRVKDREVFYFAISNKKYTLSNHEEMLAEEDNLKNLLEKALQDCTVFLEDKYTSQKIFQIVNK